MLRVQGGLLGCQCSHTQGNVRSTANSLVFMLFTKVCFASLEVPIPKRTCSAAGLLPLAQSVRGPRYSTAHGSRSPCVHRCAVFLGNQVVFVEQHSTPARGQHRFVVSSRQLSAKASTITMPDKELMFRIFFGLESKSH